MEKIYIKFMVSNRCKMIVAEILKKNGLHYIVMELGVVDVLEDISPEKRAKLKAELSVYGLELLDDKKTILIELIKSAVVEIIHHSDFDHKIKFSDFISQKLQYDYTYLANIFSEVKGITIQQFIILNKIERIKELLLYDELNANEIADKLNYSSVAHMSNQFKKITGLTPSYFKKMKLKRMANLEDV